MDKEKAAKEINDWLRKTDKSKSSEIPTLDISDKTEFDVELTKGWINRAYHIRSVEMNGSKNIESQELKKLD